MKIYYNFLNTWNTVGLKNSARLQTIAKIVSCISQVRETEIHQSFGTVWITMNKIFSNAFDFWNWYVWHTTWEKDGKCLIDLIFYGLKSFLQWN